MIFQTKKTQELAIHWSGNCVGSFGSLDSTQGISESYCRSTGISGEEGKLKHPHL